VTAAAGALTFRLEVPGRAAHGSSRVDGVSAIEAFLPLHAALQQLERERCTDPDPLMAEYRLAWPSARPRPADLGMASSALDVLIDTGP
jgi:acetylornithine deacetylase